MFFKKNERFAFGRWLANVSLLTESNVICFPKKTKKTISVFWF